MKTMQRYDAATTERDLSAFWQEEGVYHFARESEAPVYSIDTPPPTVSGNLHLGHVYSYSHADFMARFFRMRGFNVFYPMGYDDNGLPTERLVERRLGIRATEVGREAFIRACLEISRQSEGEYEDLWQRLGLSVDWRYTYSTISEDARREAQLSFLDLYRNDLVYQRQAPTIWCPECRTAIAQAEEDDLERDSEFFTLPFERPGAEPLRIATTRPELLPACVAVFVHPSDDRYRGIVGEQVRVPLFGQEVPVLTDEAADPEKGTGAVMCCTFGDTTDVEWWRRHHLPLREAIGRDGRLTAIAGEFAGMRIPQAKKATAQALEEQGLLLDRTPLRQSVRVHERCDTPVEYIVTQQWFVRALDHKEKLLRAGERIDWFPAHMRIRYREWVENLHWDWCISRQRYYGVTFPLWYCEACGEVLLAAESQLPIDPTETAPAHPCSCGGSYRPETDVMDTWATSSLSPQIAGRRLTDPELYNAVFPYSLRPQAHEIIRTWAFYTILKSDYQFDALPWQNVLISGWGLAPQGTGKISKSRGGGPMTPVEMLSRYSADALRYWAGSTGTGKDAYISEDKIAAGARLAAKLWSVANFSRRFLDGYQPPEEVPALYPTDRWLLAEAQRLIQRATTSFEAYQYSPAMGETEGFFWGTLADNYLEMAKRRLYDASGDQYESARYTLHRVFLTVLKLLAPLMPYITEAVYRDLYSSTEGSISIHRSPWPSADEALLVEDGAEVGALLLSLARDIRTYKSDRGLSLGAELARLEIRTERPEAADALRSVEEDIKSVTRARAIDVQVGTGPGTEPDASHPGDYALWVHGDEPLQE